MLVELFTKQISEATPDIFDEHTRVVKQGGVIARDARMELEEKTGQKVISPLNAKQGILRNKNSEIE